MRILISGVWDRRISSLGAQALSEGLCRTVQAVYPSAAVHMMWPASLPTLGRFVPLSDPHLFGHERWFDWVYRIYCLVNHRRVLAIQKADLLIINGDGLVADIFVTSTVLFACEIRVAGEHGVPVVSLNQSINVCSGTLAEYCVERWFMSVPLSVREVDSQRALQLRHPKSEIPLALDAAFLTAPLDQVEQARFAKYLAELKRSYSFQRYVVVGIRGNRPRDQRIDLSAWAKVIQATQRAFPGCTVLLASTCAEYDVPLARKLALRLTGVVIPEELLDWQKYSYRFFRYLLCHAQACISDRYHQNVFAVQSGVPFVPVEGNTSKTSGIRDLIDWPVPIQALPAPETLPRFQQSLSYLVDHYEQLVLHLREHAPKAIARHDGYRDFLRDVASQ